MRTVTTRDGDTLDLVLWRETGSTAALSAALEINPGLAAAGPVYPAGVTLRLPADAPAAALAPIRLWGRG